MNYAIKENYDISIIRLSKKIATASPLVQLLFILKGSTEALCDGQNYLLVEADVILLPPNCACQFTPQSNNIALLIQISPALPATDFLRSTPVIAFQANELGVPEIQQMREVLAQIASANNSQGNFADLNLYALLYRLLSLIATYQDRSAHADSNRNEPGDTVLQRVSTIQSLITQNYRQPITLNEIAKNQFISPQYLSKIFKKATGVNFYDYLNRFRLKSAVLDLIGSNATMTKICFGNGFPNLAAFNKAFKEAYGLSPHQYRAEAKNHESEQTASAQLNEEQVDFKVVEKQFSAYLGNNPSVFGQTHPVSSALIAADVSKTVELKPIWNRFFNLGFAADLSKSPLRAQIEMFQSKFQFKYARFQGIFNEYPSIVNSMNFYECDLLIDYLYSINLLPFIEIGNKPKKIDREPHDHLFSDDKNYISLSNQQLETIFTAFLKHATNRYGISEVEKWRFEFWAEHDDSLVYDSQYITEYIMTFRNLYTLTKSLLPNCQFGGPGYNMVADIGVLGNIVTGLKSLGISPDFVSFYSFPNIIIRPQDKQSPAPEQNYSMLWDRADYARNIKKLSRYIKEKNPDIANLYITEWNIDIGNRNFLHDSCFKAPYILQTLIDSSEFVDGLGYWLLSDISSEYVDSSNLLYGGAGLINRNGIRKPGYFAYDFLSEMSPGLVKKGKNHIITSRSENEYEVLVFNYKYLSHSALISMGNKRDMYQVNNLLEDQNDLAMTIQLSNVKRGKYNVKQYVLSNEHGSILDEWIKLNATDKIRQSEVNYLNNICIPKRQIFNTVTSDDGDLVINCQLLANEVDLFQIRRLLD